MGSLLPQLMRHLPAPHEVRGDPARVEAALEAALRAARQAWPDLRLADGAFLAHLAGRLPPGEELERALGALRTDDLFVACACSRGDPAAIAALEARHFGIIDAALGKLGVPGATVREVKQSLREQLFVAPPGKERPLIAGYSGRGQLRRWLRVVAVRTAFRLFSLEWREVPHSFSDDEDLDGLVRSGDDVELAYLQRTYQAEFRAAFAHAVQALGGAERTLLRQYYVDGLTIDELGRIYRVHRTSAARRVARAREAVRELTRDALMRQLGISEAGCDSILRLIDCNIEVTLPSFLAVGE
jgi:RNA polymerase sigma-70 factor (ECF subfamily)